jgi:hypothetical protein
MRRLYVNVNRPPAARPRRQLSTRRQGPGQSIEIGFTRRREGAKGPSLSEMAALTGGDSDKDH